MTRLTSLLVVLCAILAQAIPAEAQSGRSRARSITRAIAGTDRYRGDYYRGGYEGYGVYDPYGPRDGRDVYGRKLPPIEVEECEYVECFGRKGTFHAEGGLFHFRAHDSTHNPFNVNHRNCIVIRSIGPTAAQSSDQQAPSQVPVEATPVNQPVADPVAGASVQKMVRNRFKDAPVRIYNGASKILELAAGSDGVIEWTSSSRIWGEAYLENTLNKRMEWIPLQEGKGMDELPQEAGWVFGQPKTRPDLN